jgi:hypothetical protein
MKIKLCIYLLFLAAFTSCNPKKEERDKETKGFPMKDSISGAEDNESDSTIAVTLLEKFYNQQDYFVPLFFINDFSETAKKELDKNSKVLYEDDESTRSKLDEQVAWKYLLVNNLDQMVVFDSNQNSIDTLNRTNYEHYIATISSPYVASYKSTDSIEENNVVISLNGLKKSNLRKSPEFISDSLYIKKLIHKNSFKPDYIHSFGHLIYKRDTISFLSFGDYKLGKECLYLLKNSMPMDSVINDFLISTMTPVPLSSDKEIIYVALVFIPETDILWNALTGIDLKNNKFNFYERNRIKIKDLKN